MLQNSLALAQAKGGVGKTTIATNLAGIYAHRGSSVLLVDFDPQGNCAIDLGYEPSQGSAFFNALVNADDELDPADFVIRDIRPGLDVIPGGRKLSRLMGTFMSDPEPLSSLSQALEKVIRAAGEYDLIVIDTPPGDVLASQAVMAVCSHVMAPARPDDASVFAVVEFSGRFRAIQNTLNPHLQFVGVPVFAIGAASRRIERQIREELTNTIGDSSLVLPTRIRDAVGASVYARRNGLLAHELTDAVARDRARRFKALRSGVVPIDKAIPTNADKVAADFDALADEVQQRMTPITLKAVK